MVLKYLFTAEYEDGTSFSQTEEDVSVVEKTRSAFYDVLNSGKTVTRFSIEGEGHVYCVDLTTGGFTRDGEPIAGEGDPLPDGDPELRLIYYRQHRHQFNRTTREELSHDVTYVIGWQTTHNGRNYQQKLGVS